MRKSIVSQIVSRQDVCLFCALRPVRQTITTRSARAKQTTRTYSTTPRRSSAEAAAARPKDEDQDEDSPMLRQNANLLNSFPFNRQKPQPPSSRLAPISQSASPQPSADRPRWQYDRDGRSTPNRDSSPYTNRAQIGGREEPRHFRRDMDNEPKPRRPHRSAQIGSEDTRSSDRFGKFKRLQLGGTSGPESEHRGNSDRRIIPDQQYRSERTAKRSADRFQDLTDRTSRQQSSERWSFSRPEDRSYTSTFDARSSRQRSDQGSDQFPQTSSSPRMRGSYRSDDGPWTGTSPRDGQSSAGTVGGVDAPAGMSSTMDDGVIGTGERRGQREDKRKTRFSRFEDEEDTTQSPDSSPKRSIPQSSRVGGVRGNHFDFQMAEAEELLYGGRNSRRHKKDRKSKTRQSVEAPKPVIRLSEFMSVGQLAKSLGVQLDSFVRKLEEEGYEGARYDHILDAQTSAMFADLYGFDPLIAETESSLDLVARPPAEDMSALPPRPPIVTIMGHVDHGKTTILDYLRKSSVVATEHGGITQHIGAFSVTMPGSERQITFLDTPGHAAFLEMRRRGANVTDIVVLVVAADDSVKPQTVEAIKHAMEAKVQIIVAINKVDKEDSNVERVKQDLTRNEIVVEDYGGDYQAIPVSGKTGQGMAELEEAILTLADVHDFRAEIDGPAEGTIIESTVTAGGRVATVLVRRGTLRPGDFIVAGTTWARIRTLRTDVGTLVTEALPGTPVQVDGWRGEDPTAGLEVLQAENEDQAKDVIGYRLEQRESMRVSADLAAINESRSEEADARAKVRAWESQQEWAKKRHGLRPKDNAGWVEPQSDKGPKQVYFVVKADVAGSVEAVVAAVESVGNNEIVANVVHSGTGPLTEFDMKILAATGDRGYAVSFNQPVEPAIARMAEAAELQILDHNIIYKVTDVVKEKVAEHLPPIITQRVLGEAEVGQIFEVTIKKQVTKIAGCKVTNGTISRANKVRVQRNGQVVYTGTLNSLKNVKRDVTEMRKGTECGMGFQEWDGFQEGDQIQCFEEHEEKRTLY